MADPMDEDWGKGMDDDDDDDEFNNILTAFSQAARRATAVAQSAPANVPSSPSASSPHHMIASLTPRQDEETVPIPTSPTNKSPIHDDRHEQHFNHTDDDFFDISDDDEEAAGEAHNHDDKHFDNLFQSYARSSLIAVKKIDPTVSVEIENQQQSQPAHVPEPTQVSQSQPSFDPTPEPQSHVQPEPVPQQSEPEPDPEIRIEAETPKQQRPEEKVEEEPKAAVEDEGKQPESDSIPPPSKPIDDESPSPKPEPEELSPAGVDQPFSPVGDEGIDRHFSKKSLYDDVVKDKLRTDDSDRDDQKDEGEQQQVSVEQKSQLRIDTDIDGQEEGFKVADELGQQPVDVNAENAVLSEGSAPLAATTLRQEEEFQRQLQLQLLQQQQEYIRIQQAQLQMMQQQQDMTMAQQQMTNEYHDIEFRYKLQMQQPMTAEQTQVVQQHFDQERYHLGLKYPQLQPHYQDLRQQQQQLLLQQPQPKFIEEPPSPGKSSKSQSTRSPSPTKGKLTAKNITTAADTMSNTTAIDYENLGEDFLSTTWVPPSIDKMKEYQEDRVFHHGTAPLKEVKVTNTADLGPAVCLYFQLLKSMALYFFFASILSLPSIIVAFYGSRIEQQDRDALGLYRFTLGNMGYNPASATYAVDSACHSVRLMANNGTCVHIQTPLSGELEFSSRDVAYLITGLEMVQVLLFLYFLRYLTKRAKEIESKLSGAVVKVSDYTVQVSNLPNHFTSSELIQHFSKLYQLSEMDFRKRPPIRYCVPADNIFHSVPDSWVAQCTVFKRIGKMLYSFKKKSKLLDSIKQTRAFIKMFADDTVHKKGANKKKFDKMKAKLDKDQKTVQSLTRAVAGRVVAKAGTVVPEPVNDPDVETGIVISDNHDNISDPLHVINAPPVCAFVSFEYCESFARCLEDFERYNRFPWFFCYPEAMKFKGRKLKIKKAPEPDEMLWENIEISHVKRMFYRSISSVLSAILCLIVFVALLQTTITKNRLKEKIPDLANCNMKIPLMYTNTSNAAYDTDEYIGSLELTRPTNKDDQSAFDSKCNDYFSGSFYAVYAVDGNYNKKVTCFMVVRLFRYLLTELVGIFIYRSLEQILRSVRRPSVLHEFTGTVIAPV
jgi:RNA recognition motif-containing protein